jgi:hypothetical protein
LEERLPLVQSLAPGRDLGAAPERGAARAPAGATQQESRAQRAGIVDSQSARTTGVGGKECGFDPATKKVGKGGSAICWWTPKAWYCEGAGPQRQGVRRRRHKAAFGAGARSLSPPLAFLWVDAGGYQGRGKRWGEEVLGLSVEVVRKPPKPVPEEVAKAWAREWAKEGKEVDWQSLLPPRGFKVLPRRWVVERGPSRSWGKTAG